MPHLDVVVREGGLDAQGAHAEALVAGRKLDGLLQQAHHRLALAARPALHRPQPRVRFGRQQPLLPHQPDVLLLVRLRWVGGCRFQALG